jgi:hypothetical protein
MREIQLTRGKVAFIDDEDYDWLTNWSWHTKIDKKNFYAIRKIIGEDGKQKKVYMHRQIMGLTNPTDKVDHIDGNGLNNQKYNLRKATTVENCWNSRKRVGINHSSKFKGVSNYKPGKWRATIICNGKRFHLGCYNSETECAEAYNNAALLMFGQFAKLNDI